MSIRFVGAVLILFGCGWFGCAMANAHRAQEQSLRQLIRALEWMQCELQFRQTPLPQLCRHTANILSGMLRKVFFCLEEQMNRQTYSDAAACMTQVLRAQPNLPENLRDLLIQLGQGLGQFDLSGQLSSLRALQLQCGQQLKQLSDNRENRLRSYQTLGLCTGAALAVLLI